MVLAETGFIRADLVAGGKGRGTSSPRRDAVVRDGDDDGWKPSLRGPCVSSIRTLACAAGRSWRGNPSGPVAISTVSRSRPSESMSVLPSLPDHRARRIPASRRPRRSFPASRRSCESPVAGRRKHRVRRRRRLQVGHNEWRPAIGLNGPFQSLQAFGSFRRQFRDGRRSRHFGLT
jgi:hypothetical protein